MSSEVAEVTETHNHLIPSSLPATWTCPITLRPIPYNVAIMLGGHHFDLRGVFRLVMTLGYYATNPCTNRRFSEGDLATIHCLASCHPDTLEVLDRRGFRKWTSFIAHFEPANCPITLEPIPDDATILLSGALFDIRAILDMVIVRGAGATHPYTRRRFSKDDLASIHQLASRHPETSARLDQHWASLVRR